MSPQSTLAPASDASEAALRRFWVGVGTQLRDGRLARRWSIAELAFRAGISRRSAYNIESGLGASMQVVIRLAGALGLRLDAVLVDPRKKADMAAKRSDPVHSFMGEREAGWLRMPGYKLGLDEPYQHYQFAGRADLVAWDLDARALLHIENRTRFPDFQEMAGVYNAKRAYLGAAIGERLGLRHWASETHVIAALWTAEVIHALRMRPESFRTLCPDVADTFRYWWVGQPPDRGVTSTLILIDPLADRQQKWLDLETAIASARPRHRGYADVAAKLTETAG